MIKKIKILFATDFSPATRKVTELVTRLQSKIPCDISFIHVIPSRWKEFFSSGLCKKAALQRLETWQQEISKLIDKNKLYVEYGNAADAIVYLSQQLKPDLLVIGGKELDKKGRYKTGATVESVVRYAKQSVLVCKIPSIEKILCGIDGSDNSAAALNEAIKICNLFSASLRLVYVLFKIDFNPLGMSEEEIEKQEEKYRQQKIGETEEFLKRFDFTGIHVEQHFLWGDPGNVILDMAEDFDQDLIVVGAKGHSLLHHVLIGSTTEKILRHASCSLLVVR
jgi:nucleotide-binding universal stress UspA family protein